MEQKKLKQQYILSAKPRPHWFGEFQLVFLYRRDYMHRHFSTKQEKSYAVMHALEYKEYKLRIRPKRGKCLPKDWDDFPAFVHDGERDWKRNSKRRHQYYRIKSV